MWIDNLLFRWLCSVSNLMQGSAPTCPGTEQTSILRALSCASRMRDLDVREHEIVVAAETNALRSRRRSGSAQQRRRRSWHARHGRPRSARWRAPCAAPTTARPGSAWRRRPPRAARHASCATARLRLVWLPAVRRGRVDVAGSLEFRVAACHALSWKLRVLYVCAAHLFSSMLGVAGREGPPRLLCVTCGVNRTCTLKRLASSVTPLAELLMRL